MKQIKLDPIILIGIVLILVGLILSMTFYYNMATQECIRNPVAYANNYSDEYEWDEVIPMSWDKYTLNRSS